MTRIESTSSPRSQTARQKRSTITVVFPVPAPAERVERDLQVQLGLDLSGRVRGLAGLVVDDEAAGAERVAVDAVDLPGDGEAAQVEPALQLRCRALGAERDLEAVRQERRRR